MSTATEWEPLFGEAEVPEEVAEGWLNGLGVNRAAPAQVLIALLDAEHATFLFRRDLPDGVLDAAVTHPVKRVWATAVDSGQLTAEQWDRLLAATAHLGLHKALTEIAEEERSARLTSRGAVGIERPPSVDARPPATPAEIAAWAEQVPEIPAEDRTYALWWVAALYGDPDAMRQLAGSPKLWVRRSVARAPHLPAEVARQLGADEDRIVRLFLTESCADAPPEALLDVWTWWQGSFSFPGRPRNHPNFPEQDLLRFAEDPQPRMRLLALDDKRSTAELVERFGRDPDPEVRLRAAEDPRLSAASAVRLTKDADSAVRGQARRHPALPVPVLLSLLLAPESARDAAANRAVPAAVMLRMVELAHRRLR
ncbi:hypothetical protein [Kitasatospora viridis]|uniref:Leucine rich repeat (LRR) protein n=1 Tax=Kitasatospora viridis TaxID=281105 RepID=A0A561SFE5_9ACTN|nr:hypothetical protein [Kitasatospora viridis]TWF73589.1 leucine rich repeat (LRR) protein [Kitasatospora viridis]